MDLNNKGFTYIIIVIIMMIFITMLFVLSRSVIYKENKSEALMNNYKNELTYLIENDINESSLDLLNSSFKEFIISNNYNIKICDIFYNGSVYYLSNYQDSNYDLINDKTTITVLKEDVNETITFGECDFNTLNNINLNYYLEIYNDQERRIYKE